MWIKCGKRICISPEVLQSPTTVPSFLPNRCMAGSLNLPIPISPSKRSGGLGAPAPLVRCDCCVRISNAPNNAAVLAYSCPRYQHLDIYLRKPSEKRIAPPPPVAAAAATKTAGQLVFASNPSAPGKGPARSPATKLSAAGTSSDETALESKQPIQHQLPAIDFSGECEPSRQAEPGGDRGGGREGANPPPKPSERQAVSPAERPTGDGGEDATMEGEDSGEETTSVDGEEDFLALPTESGESGSGTTEGEVRFVPGGGLWLLALRAFPGGNGKAW